MALGVMAEAQRLGLGVPSELSIAGFDDSPGAALVYPPLTTVRQPLEEMARLAVDLLITPGAEQESEPADRVLAHRLVVRGSTARRTRDAACASVQGATDAMPQP
jgi:LacI family transcriptional regulator